MASGAHAKNFQKESDVIQKKITDLAADQSARISSY